MANRKFMMFHDRKFGISLRLPAWWKPYITVRTSQEGPESEYVLQFLFRYGGTLYGEVLTVHVFRTTLKRWKKYYGDSPLGLLGAFGGRVYAWSVPGELPYGFVDPETGEYDEERFGVPIHLMKRMVNKDVPAVVRSFRWNGVPGDSHAPVPYLAPGVWPGQGCGCAAE